MALNGKGGTGKTSIIGALADPTENKVLTDCDLNAADSFDFCCIGVLPGHAIPNKVMEGHDAR